MAAKCSADGLYFLARRVKYANETRFLLITGANLGGLLFGKVMQSQEEQEKLQRGFTPMFFINNSLFK